MKHLKTYETIKDARPKLNDYIILNIKTEEFYPKDIVNFINNNIGQLIDIFDENVQPYKIYYKNIPENIKDLYTKDYRRLCVYNTWYAQQSEILIFDKDKEKLEAEISANKYNI